MTTLLAVYKKGDGGKMVCVGRCDARCYNAKHPDCDCICGGRNHGCKEERAISNTREHYEEWLEEYKERKGLTDIACTLPVTANEPA